MSVGSIFPWASIVFGIITAITALYAVRVSLITQENVAKQISEHAILMREQMAHTEKNEKNKVLSDMREKWIHRFREGVSEFIGYCFELSTFSMANKDLEKRYEKLGLIARSKSSVELFLNPQLDKHKELQDLMDNIMVANVKAGAFNVCLDVKDRVMLLTKAIIHEEWKRMEAWNE